MGYDLDGDRCMAVVSMGNGQVGGNSTRWGLKLVNAPAFVQADANRVANLFRDNLKLLYDTSWNLGPVKFYFDNGSGPAILEDPTTELGTQSAIAYAPPQVSYIVKKTTAQAGAKNRGRVYMPGLAESNVDEAGRVDGAFIAAGNAILATFFAAINADAAVDYMTLVHTTEAGGGDTAITALTIQGVCGTQRTRLRRT
jgi:hypothetical protein